MIIHAGFAATSDFLGHHIGGQCNDRDFSNRSVQFADMTRGFPAVHDRHLHVHEHAAERTFLHGSKRLDSVGDNHHIMPVFREQRFSDDLVDWVVIN